MKVFLASIVVASVCIAFSISQKENASVDDAVNKAAIEKLKHLIVPVIPKTSYVYKWAKDDLYLHKWLKASSMDVEKAYEMMLNHLKWRESENIDEIDNEDLSEGQQRFPLFLDTFDKQGRPIAEIPVKEWNVYQAILDGKTELINRWLLRFYEILNRRLYEARANGKDVSGVIVLEDMEGLSLFLHLCPYCLPLYSSTCDTVEKHYPSLYDTVYIVNAPTIVDVLIWTVQPFLKQETFDSLKFFSKDQDWKSILDNVVDPTQRGTRFGGSLQRL